MASTKGNTERVSERRFRLQVEFASREKNGDSVVPNGSGEQNLVARAHGPRIDVHTGQERTDAGRGDVHPVSFAMLHDLRVTACNSDSRLPGGLGHGADFGLKNLRRQPGLQDESDDDGLRSCAGNGQVIDGPIDRELADRAAGKTQRLHHEAICSDGQLRSCNFERGGITQRLSGGAEKKRSKQAFDQPAAGNSARAVGHFDLRLTKAHLGRNGANGGVLPQAGHARLVAIALRCS